VSERVDDSDDLPDARVERWATHQVAGTGRPASPQVAHRFETFQEALTRRSLFQATAVAQAIAHRYVTALDGLGRFTSCAVQTCPDVLGARAGGRHGLHIRLVIVGDDLCRDHLGARDGLPEQRDGAGRVTMVAQEHVNDLTVLVDCPVQIPLLAPAKQEDLIHEPAPANSTTAATHPHRASSPLLSLALRMAEDLATIRAHIETRRGPGVATASFWTP